MSLTFYAPSETRTARTMHACSVCHRKIKRGERYTVQNSYQDRWVTWRTCEHCEAALRTAWNLRLIDDEWDELDLFDALRDWSVTTARLAVGMRRKWLAFCGYGLMPVPDVTPRRCVDCSDAVDAPRSYTWCERHDAERIERISGQLAGLAATFGAMA